MRQLGRALCSIKVLPVTHILVDTWMLTVKPVYKLSNVFDDLKWATNKHTYDTIYTHFQGISMVLEDLFLLLRFFYQSTHIFLSIHIHFYPSK